MEESVLYHHHIIFTGFKNHILKLLPINIIDIFSAMN